MNNITSTQEYEGFFNRMHVVSVSVATILIMVMMSWMLGMVSLFRYLLETKESEWDSYHVE